MGRGMQFESVGRDIRVVSAKLLRSVNFTAIPLAAFILILTVTAFAQTSYQKPPKDVLDVLNAPLTPTASLSPARDYMLLAQGVRYPPITELAQPMLRLAGLRINPNTNGPHLALHAVKLSLKRVSDKVEVQVELPPNAQISFPQWGGDGKYFVFTNTTANNIELWVGETATAKARLLQEVKVRHHQQSRWLGECDHLKGGRT